jgi:hypothetical protein
MNATVTAILNTDSATLEDAKTFVKSMKDKGRWSPAAARKRNAALEAVASIISDDESHLASYVFENAERLTKAWATRNYADPDTAGNYGATVKSTLKVFLAYLENPAKAWDGYDTKPKKAKKAKDVEPEVQFTTPPTVATEQKVTAPVVDFLTYPLEGGRVVKFTVPGGFKLNDLAKLSCHLATYAEDFDPMRPNQSTVTGMMRVDQPSA